MKVRENELHEVLAVVVKSELGAISVQTLCPVCRTLLHDPAWWQFREEEELVAEAKKQAPNYCPRCGARLKNGEQSDEIYAIVPPCRIGQEVYFPEVTEVTRWQAKGTVHVGKVSCFNIEEGCQEAYATYEDGLTYWHGFKYFGESVFTDKEKAKEVLTHMLEEAIK